MKCLSHVARHNTTEAGMIRSFRHRGLKRLYERGDRSRLPTEMADKTEDILAALDVARTLENVDRPYFRLHPLTGGRKGEPDYPPFSSSDDDAVGPGLGVQRGPHQALGHGVELKATDEAPGDLKRSPAAGRAYSAVVVKIHQTGKHSRH